MHTLTASTLLQVWERGLGKSSVTQGLILLAAASPDKASGKVDCLPIGDRDALLLTLREQLFGPRVQTQLLCPECHNDLDLAFDVGQIRVPQERDLRREFVCCVDEYQVTFRLPTSEDLLIVLDEQKPDLAKQLLLKRCLLQVRDHINRETELPPSLMSRVSEQMAQVDPQGDVQLAVTCAVCGHQWHALFDIVSFVWREIGAWAKRLLRDVHIVASAYGWSEESILRMSAWRRQSYLDMVQG